MFDLVLGLTPPIYETIIAVLGATAIIQFITILVQRSTVDATRRRLSSAQIVIDAQSIQLREAKYAITKIVVAGVEAVTKLTKELIIERNKSRAGSKVFRDGLRRSTYRGPATDALDALFFGSTPFRLGTPSRDWDGQTSTVEDPTRKPPTVADIEKALDALGGPVTSSKVAEVEAALGATPGSIKVAMLGPDGEFRDLTGVEAEDALLAAFNDGSLQQAVARFDRDLGVKGGDGDHSLLHRRLATETLQNVADSQERVEGLTTINEEGHGFDHEPHLPADAEACDTQRSVPRYARGSGEGSVKGYQDNWSYQSPRAG